MMVVVVNKSEFNIDDELEKIREQTFDVANASLNTHKKMIDSFNGMVDEYTGVLQEYIQYVASDIIDSYSKLEIQRKECIDKYINFYEIVFKDGNEVDIIKPMKSLMEKQQEDIARWQSEVAPLLELKKFSDETSNEKANEVLELFKNL